jgi:hypothetical protein
MDEKLCNAVSNRKTHIPCPVWMKRVHRKERARVIAKLLLLGECQVKDECSSSDLVYHGSDWVSWFGLLIPIAGRFSQIGLCVGLRIFFI